MSAKILAVIALFCFVQAIQGGVMKFPPKPQDPAITELVNQIQYERTNLQIQFELATLNIRAHLDTAKINGKLELSQYQQLLKLVDPVCAAPAKLSLKTIEKSLDSVKTCQLKEEFKAPRKQNELVLKSMSSQVNNIAAFCNAMQGTPELVDQCVQGAVQSIKTQVDEVGRAIRETINNIVQQASACLDTATSTYESSIVEAKTALDLCLNPTTPAAVESNESENSEESNESSGSSESSESSGSSSEESGEVTTQAQEETTEQPEEGTTQVAEEGSTQGSEEGTTVAAGEESTETGAETTEAVGTTEVPEESGAAEEGNVSEGNSNDEQENGNEEAGENEIGSGVEEEPQENGTEENDIAEEEIILVASSEQTKSGELLEEAFAAELL